MKRDVAWAVVLGILLLGAGVFIGLRMTDGRYQEWRVKAQLALAKSDSVATEAALLEIRADSLARSVATYADRVARQDARIAVERRTANEAVAALKNYRAGLDARGDTTVPRARLDEALAVIDQQAVVITEQDNAIALRDRQIQAGAELRVAVEQQRDLWMGRADELEKVLIDLKPPTKPRLLGIIPAPSPTVTFVLGAVAGFVASR